MGVVNISRKCNVRVELIEARKILDSVIKVTTSIDLLSSAGMPRPYAIAFRTPRCNSAIVYAIMLVTDDAIGYS